MKTKWMVLVFLAGTAGVQAQEDKKLLKHREEKGKTEIILKMKKEAMPLCLKDVLLSLQSETQRFRVEAGRDTVLKGKKGTLLYFNGNSLVDMNGNPVSGKVEICLKESMEYAEMIGDKLSTVTDSGLLETRGMVKLSASSGDK